MDWKNLLLIRWFEKSLWLILLFYPCFLLADALPPPSTPAAQIAAAPNARPLTMDTRSGVFHYPGHGNVATITRPAGHYGTASPGSGGTLTGNKTHPIRLTDSYGNTATGQIRTATAVSGGALDAAVKGYVIGDLAGRVVNSPNAHNAAQSLANGRYGEAALSAAAALDVMNIGGGINSLMDTYRQAQNAKTAALVAEHQQAAQTYEQVKNLPQVSVVYMSHRQGNDSLPYPGYGIYRVFSELVYLSGGFIKASNGHRVLGHYPFMIDGYHVSYRVHDTPPSPEMFYKPITPEQLMLNQQEITQILLQQLHDNNSALNQNTQALTDLLNALVAGGHLDPSKQPTQVLGTPAENTFVTPPFTPAGSNQAQQTQFIVNSDGSVTVSTINRPDLVANTSQAPTRAEVGQTAPSQSETRDVKQGSTTEAPDICAQNPNSLMCAPVGSTDYQDFVLPQQQINIALNPMAVFSTDAQCPAPTNFSLVGTQQTMSYDTVCSTARKARPFIIMLGMFVAFMMVYGALARK